MIQRIQTLWLLAASVCAFISLKISFYIGSIGTAPAEHYTGTTNLIILILTVICATVSLLAIFLYKNRPLQMKISLANIALSILIIVLYISGKGKYTSGGYALTAIIVFIIPVLLLLAVRGIYKDQKLVKSADRLR